MSLIVAIDVDIFTHYSLLLWIYDYHINLVYDHDINIHKVELYYVTTYPNMIWNR